MKALYNKLTWLVGLFTICESHMEDRIVEGYVVTSRSDFSYQASVRLHNAHFCGGVLVDDMHVLTAAHCVVKLTTSQQSQIKVVLGDLNLVTGDSNTVKVNVDKVTSHEDYDVESHINDIAIIKLKHKVKVSEHVKPIDIWNSSSLPNNTLSCTISGWGLTSQGAEELSRVLMAAEIYPVDQTTCSQVYLGNIKNGMMCAAAPGKFVCQGDSGGPLVCDDKLAGLVSWGVDCANSDYPGVYTFVQNYTTWIETNNAKNVVFSVSLMITLVIHVI